MNQNSLTNPIEREKRFLIFITCVFFFIFLYTAFAEGASFFEDNFEAYSTGTLIGQGSWATTTGHTCPGVSHFQVDDNCHNGSRCGQMLKSDLACNISLLKTGDSIASGYISFYSRYNGTSSSLQLNISLVEDTTSKLTIRHKCYNSNCELYGYIINYYDSDEGDWQDLCIISDQDYWTSVQVQWDSFTNLFRMSCDLGTWTDWFSQGTTFSYINGLKLSTGDFSAGINPYLMIDDIEEYSDDVVILEPESGEEVSASFNFVVDYDTGGEDYNKIMIIPEIWSSSSSCPAYGSAEWTEEYNLGYFEYQALPYYSDTLSTSTGTTTVDQIENLRSGEYNCFRCYFFNETTQTISGEKCRSPYSLTVSDYIPDSNIPDYTFLIDDFEDYYASNTDSQFATPTTIFLSISSGLDTLNKKLAEFILNFGSLFDIDEAGQTGEQYGQKIALASAYVGSINSIFSDFPLVQIVSFCLVALILKSLYGIILNIINLIRG